MSEINKIDSLQPNGFLWKSYEDVQDIEAYSKKSKQLQEVVEDREFSEEVQKLLDRGLSLQLDRRSFLTLMGASLSLASINCHKRPAEKILPYLVRPSNHVPGVSDSFASVYVNNSNVVPIMVTTRSGKPIKIEGHHEHPLFKGAVDANTIASIWDLYDPDRLKHPLVRKESKRRKATWKSAIQQAKDVLDGKGNVVVMSRPSYSPSETNLVNQFVAQYKATKVVYDPIGTHQEIIEGEKLAYGKRLIPFYRFDKADFILSIGADFLGTWLSPELFTKQFSSRRDPDKSKKMSQLVVAEDMMSLTGANADERLAIRSGSHIVFGLGLAHLLLPKTSYSQNIELKIFLSDYTPDKVATYCRFPVENLIRLSNNIIQHKGSSLIVAGGPSTQVGYAGKAHYVASLLNTLLENDGKTILPSHRQQENSDVSGFSDLPLLIAKMKSGRIDTLVIDRVNPIFDLPDSMGFYTAISKVKNVIVLSDHLNETAELADIILPTSHPMEAWSDAVSYSYYYIAQPTIRPLFDTKSAGDVWLSLISDKLDTSYYDYIKNQVSIKYIGSNWNNTLSKGFRKIGRLGHNTQESQRKFNSSNKLLFKFPSQRTKDKGYRLSVYETVQLRDGSGANISFRQELPDPVTKVTWGNYVAVSIKDAQKNEWSTNDMLRITTSSLMFELPLFIQPGLQEGSMAVALGFGHSKLGKIAKGVGVNTNIITGSSKTGLVYSGIQVEAHKTGKQQKIATTQKHHEIPGSSNRGIIHHTTLKEYKQNKRSGLSNYSKMEPGTPHLPGKGLYPGHAYKNDRWGMSIDLSKCTGCSACVISCYSENNVPAVGKSEVLVGREMSWLRIDRYYTGSPESPSVIFQPVMCQHCENAPCENVCPVVATTHTSDGLNGMSYNRCIGTRYCANNCPYKVRRFNWFENWEDKIQDPQQYALNPDVTVRSRGVIEKCSFCVQRISSHRQQKRLGPLETNNKTLETACQQACPADAIVFGNVNDPLSAVTAKKESQRSYQVLLQTNVKPSVSYMTKVSNS